MPSSTRPTKILILEDEAFVSDLYRRALTKYGYDVEVEQDGKKGLKLVESGAYDIVLLDLMLPHLSGIDILNQLRGKSDKSKVKSKIVVMTNLEYQDEKREEIERLADAYLLKANTTPRQLIEFLSSIDLANS